MRGFVEKAQELAGCHITLMDIDADRLELIYTIGTKLFQSAGIDLTIEQTTLREEALDDADFVLTTIRTGGLQARHFDETIPLRHNLIGHDTIGAGGFFYALRTAPIIAGIAAEIEKVAPKAFLLNYTSPGNIVNEAIAHSSGIRVIGLNNAPSNPIESFARAAGVSFSSENRLYPRTVGLSQGNWTTAVWSEGRDILPRIVAWCREYISTQPAMTPTNYEQIMLATLTADYEAIPSAYLHYYYFPEQILQFLQNKPTSLAEDLMAQVPQLTARYKTEALQDVPRLGTGAVCSVLDILSAILNDTGDEWVLSVQNKGAVNFLEDDRVVEIPCIVDASGATPLAQGDGDLEINQTGLISLIAEYTGATAKAALWGTRRDAIKALAANPLVMSYSKAEKVYDELATAHAQYLPARLLK
jgi:6-phospho-beta-glucosidase